MRRVIEQMRRVRHVTNYDNPIFAAAQMYRDKLAKCLKDQLASYDELPDEIAWMRARMACTTLLHDKRFMKKLSGTERTTVYYIDKRLHNEWRSSYGKYKPEYKLRISESKLLDDLEQRLKFEMPLWMMTSEERQDDKRQQTLLKASAQLKLELERANDEEEADHQKR